MMINRTTKSAKRPNSTDAYVGSKVRIRRKILGMSQEKLGGQLGITFQQVQKYENGANRIGASRLQAISQILEMPISYFFPQEPAVAGGMGESAQSDYVSDFMMSSEGIELNRAFAQIKDPKLRRKVIDLVRTMAAANAA